MNLDLKIALICTVASIIGTGLGIYLSGFLKKKGENLATKLDIANITEKIENIKFNLSRELELLKISQAEIQLKKTEVFIEFSAAIVDVLTGKMKADSKAFRNQANKLGINIFFFGSEETVRKFLAYKSLEGAQEDKLKPLTSLAELYVSMRKDLGFTDSNLSSDDFLKILITDWEEHKNINS